MGAPERDQPLGEREQLGVDVLPARPADRVVLAVRVVVALLRATELVAPEKHRHALGEQQRRHEVSLLAMSQRPDRLVVGAAFRSAVPRSVVILTVAALLTVGEVVLLVEAHEVAECEAVVRGDEVDARVRTPAVALVEVARSGQSVRELTEPAALVSPVIADVVAVATVPLRPLGWEVADLIATLAEPCDVGESGYQVSNFPPQ